MSPKPWQHLNPDRSNAGRWRFCSFWALVLTSFVIISTNLVSWKSWVSANPLPCSPALFPSLAPSPSLPLSLSQKHIHLCQIFVCVCISVCTYRYTHIHVCTDIHAHTYTLVCTHVHTHTYILVCTDIYLHIYIFIYTLTRRWTWWRGRQIRKCIECVLSLSLSLSREGERMCSLSREMCSLNVCSLSREFVLPLTSLCSLSITKGWGRIKECVKWQFPEMRFYPHIRERGILGNWPTTWRKMTYNLTQSLILPHPSDYEHDEEASRWERGPGAKN